MSKRVFYSFILFIMFCTCTKAQRHELGVQLGMSNLVGDIGRTNYFLQKPITENFAQFGLPFYGGILYRMNFNPYQSIRFNLGYNFIQFSDRYADETYRRNRGLYGTNSMGELSVLFEYNFLPVNDEQKSMLSPYIFGGMGALLAETVKVSLVNDFNRDPGGVAIAPTNAEDFVTTQKYDAGRKITMAIPFGVGLKYKFNYNWAIFGELMFRPTFSDGIDYSEISNNDIKMSYNKDILAPDSKKSLLQTDPYLQVAEKRKEDFIKDRQVGNINSKDWVNSVTIGLTYSFGRPPCYCD